MNIILAWILAHLLSIVLVVSITILVVIIMRRLIIRHEAYVRQWDLYEAWEAFHRKPVFTKEIYAFYVKGIHAVDHYGANFTSFGCVDEYNFCNAAQSAAQTMINQLTEIYHINVRKYEAIGTKQSEVDLFHLRRTYTQEVDSLEQQIARLKLGRAGIQPKGGYEKCKYWFIRIQGQILGQKCKCPCTQ